jgi:hypothetical protein
MGPSSTRRRLATATAVVALIAGCGGDDGNDQARQQAAAMPPGISESALPAGFTRTPSVTQGGKEYRFDNVPGHY